MITVAKANTDNTYGQMIQAVQHAVVRVGTQQNEEVFKKFHFKEISLAKLQIYDIDIDPITILRRPEDMDQDPIDAYFLTTLVEGCAIIEQDGRQLQLKPGMRALMSGNMPYSIRYLQHSRRLILCIPQRIFHERIIGSSNYDFKANILHSGGLTPVVIDLFKSLTLKTEKLSETEQYTLAESFLELSAAVIRSSVESEDQGNKAKHSALMCRILSHLEKHYTDYQITPEKVARDNGISIRYLHSLFHQSGSTVSKWIWERRLKATREDLLDPAMLQERISEIAFKRGFNDPAHFSRSFKERYGLSPSQLRAKGSEASDSAPEA